MMKIAARHLASVRALHAAVAAQSGVAVRRVLDADPLPGAVHPAAATCARASAAATCSTSFLPGILALLAFASGSGPGLQHDLRAARRASSSASASPPPADFAILLGPILSGMVLMFVFDIVLSRSARRSAFMCTARPARARGADRAADGRRWPPSRSRRRSLTKDISSFRGDHQRHEPAAAAAGGRAFADLARPAVDARARALQPALLPRRRLARSRGGHFAGRPSGRRSPCSSRLPCSCWPGRRASSAARRLVAASCARTPSPAGGCRAAARRVTRGPACGCAGREASCRPSRASFPRARRPAAPRGPRGSWGRCRRGPASRAGGGDPRRRRRCSW